MYSPELKMLQQTFVPIRFVVWQAENKEDLKQEFGDEKNFVEDQRECDRCDGLGTEECNLGHDHECIECDGDGKLTQTYEEALHDYSMEQYHEQVAKDKEKLRVYDAT